MSKDPIASSNPFGDYVDGIGDADVQAVLARHFDTRWRFAAGFRVFAPTGSELFGTGN
jgi:hypothetical protein